MRAGGTKSDARGARTGFRHMLHRLGAAMVEPTEGKRLLGIPDEPEAVIPIIVGVPAETPPAPGRHTPQIDWVDGPG